MIQELESRSITEWVVVPQSAINWEEADSNDIYITFNLSPKQILLWNRRESFSKLKYNLR